MRSPLQTIRALAPAALVALTAAGFAAPLAGQARVEDTTKALAVVPPDGFHVSGESSAEALVFEGPTLGGVVARLELRSVFDGRPLAEALAGFCADTLGYTGDEEPGRWFVERSDGAFAVAEVTDRVSKRKNLRTAVAVTRHGPRTVVARAEASPEMFEQQEDGFLRCLEELELLPIEPVWHDEGMGVSLHSLPDWMGLVDDETEKGKRALFRWKDKRNEAAVEITLTKGVEDGAAALDEREAALGSSSGVEQVTRHEQPVSGLPGARFECTYRGGSTRWELQVVRGDQVVTVSCTCPTRLVKDSFAEIFGDVLRHVEVHPVGG